jgi:hypothetical protein
MSNKKELEMPEKLTKTALKDELTRRIEWFEKSYKFNSKYNDISKMNPNTLLMYGRYLALTEQRFQIGKGLFIGGFAC